MMISVVTISFNQARYLPACIASVATQAGPWQHVIVDPGSTDGSREIIKACAGHFSKTILEPDRGPADGLNKGFQHTRGEIFYYLNADDIVLPGAFDEARAFFDNRPEVDVVSGHGHIIDENGHRQRAVWSDPISRHGLAHGGAILIQPATFIRRRAMERTNRFNCENRSSWDSELVTDLFLTGATFAVVERYWAGFRLHNESISGTGRLADRSREWICRRYEILTGRKMGWDVSFINQLYRVRRVLRRPSAIISQLTGGRYYGRRRKRNAG